MSRPDAYTPGQFSWVDLLTPDVDASTRFYAGLLAWSHEDQQDHHGNRYRQFLHLGQRVAGMGEMGGEMKQAGMPAVWNSYVSVEDAADTAARAVDLGGRIEMPVMSISTAGSMAILADPEGARISIWQPGDHIGAGLVNEPGSFSWNELLSRDVDGARRFYGDLFGWDVRSGVPEAGGYCEIYCGDRANGGVLPWQSMMGEVPPSWSVYFSVVDCDAALERVAALGGQVIVPARDIPPGRFAVVSDPAGAVFDGIQLRDPE